LPLQTALIAFWADYWGTASAALWAVYFVIGWQIIAWRRHPWPPPMPPPKMHETAFEIRSAQL